MSELLCKWLREDMTTKNGTRWEINVPKELPEKDDLQLHYPGLFHYYEHPLIASTLHYLHVPECYSKLYQVKPEGKIVKGIEHCGATKLTVIKQLEVPDFTDAQKVGFAILCALEVYDEPNYIKWGNDWLSGKDRSDKSTLKARSYSRWYDGYCDVWSMDNFVHYTSKSAYYAALAAFHLVDSVICSTSVYSDVREAVYYYNGSSVDAAIYGCKKNNKQMNLVEIANKAMEVK